MRTRTTQSCAPPTQRATLWVAGLLLLAAAAGASGQNSTASDPLSVVKHLYAAFDRGDLQAVSDSIAEDVVWTQYGPEYSLPFAGVFHGRAGVLQFFKVVDDTLTDVHAGQRDYWVAGNRVIVPGWEESTVRSTGGRYRVEQCPCVHGSQRQDRSV